MRTPLSVSWESDRSVWWHTQVTYIEALEIEVDTPWGSQRQYLVSYYSSWDDDVSSAWNANRVCMWGAFEWSPSSTWMPELDWADIET